MDCKSGYWQVAMNESDKHKTAFITDKGIFQFNVMPFGLSGAASTFQRNINKLLQKVAHFARAYQDDIIIFSNNLTEHLAHVKVLLNLLKQYKIKINAEKCAVAQTTIKFCGYLISKDHVRVDPDRVAVIKTFEVPNSKAKLRSFLGMVDYLIKFLQI